ncbi:MAG TPA: caspase family protein [Terriglobales bacterium]|nr:caspase family protein [Terriglobales bacterium]
MAMLGRALLVAAEAQPTPAPPTLWVLSAGVSRYADSALSLNFADNDAAAVAGALQEQSNRRVYGAVQTRLLTNEQVTRESILSGIRDFIAKAEPTDVAAIFLAGHGVRDLLTGTYYFLPHPATRENFFTRGLRVEELNDMVRILQRHVRHVVVILDTCHAGALDLRTAQMTLAEDFPIHVRAEGVFLLAATRPGDKSKEVPRLQHGVFTYALLRALRGEANAGADGLLSLAELVIHLGLEVPRLTQEQQTPYYLIAGSDLVFADVRQPNSIAVVEFRNHGPGEGAGTEWMGRSLQEAFYFALGSIPVLNRCALQSSDDNQAATPSPPERGCSKVITGSYVLDGELVDLRARVVDSATDADEVTASIRGKRSDFVRLRDQLVRDLIRRMPLVKAYLLMLEAQGVEPDSLPLTAPRPPEPQSRAPRSDSWSADLAPFLDWLVPRPADAQTAVASAAVVPVDQQVRQMLERYRAAHEDKQIEALAGLWSSFSSRQREATRRYFDQAGNLTLELTDVVIEPHQSEITVAFTRVERFVDRESGKPVRLQLAQRMILARQGDDVKITRIESR